MFLLSGLFCCLGFSRVLYFLLFGRVRVLFFAVWAGARAPPKQQIKHAPAQTAKNITRPRPFRSFCVGCCSGGWACFICFAVWAGGVFFCCLGEVRVFFLLLGRGRVICFAVWAGVLFFSSAVWAGGVLFFFCCLGGGRVFFCCCLGGGREFTHLPVCLARL